MVAVAVEGEHRVDEVLDGPRAGQVAVLGDMPDQEDRDAAGLRQARQALDAGAHLGQAAGRLGQIRIAHRLQRVDHDEGRVVMLDGLFDRPDVGSFEGQEVARHRDRSAPRAHRPG